MVAKLAEAAPAEPTHKPFAETLKIAAYGANNSRKTLQIGHLIEAYGPDNVGVISCEHGLNTIGSLLDERYIKVVDNRQQLREAFVWHVFERLQ